MRIKCKGCGSWHDISPTGLAVVIDGFQEGDLTYVHNGAPVTSICVLQAFNDPERMKEFHQRYKGNQIRADGIPR